MYTEKDRLAVEKELHKRWLVAALPTALIFVAAVALFVYCQLNRLDWGWMITCGLTILAGAYFLFLWGTYLGPMRLYQRHVGYMLSGRMRETEGILQEVGDVPEYKEGLSFFPLVVNVGNTGDPEDERLLYYDALKGAPSIALGTRVKALSNDKMISSIQMI